MAMLAPYVSAAPGVGTGVVRGLGSAGSGRDVGVSPELETFAVGGAIATGTDGGLPDIPIHTTATSPIATTAMASRAEPPPRTRTVSGRGPDTAA